MATTEPASPPSVRREFTVRAVAAGCALGAVLAAGNVYTSLKTGFIDGMSIPAVLLAFMIFSGARRFGGGHFGVRSAEPGRYQHARGARPGGPAQRRRL